MSEFNANNQDPLDKLFRRKAEKYDISYRESDWNSLEKRLDAVDAQYYARRRKIAAAAILVLVISALSFFIYQNNRQIDQLNEQITQSEKTINTPSINQAPNNRQTANTESTEESNKEITDAEEQSAMEPNNHNKSDGAVPASDYKYAVSLPQNFAIEDIECEQCPLTDFHQQHSIIDPAGIIPAQSTNRNSIADAPAAGKEIAQTTDRDSQAKPNASIGILAGPDLSAAGSMSQFYEPGSKFGVMVTYPINNTIALSLGAIRSDVRYTAGRGQYNPPTGYWGYGGQPSKTIARCVLIDVPLSISYRFMDFSRSRLYASATAASYIMLTENYQFQYETASYNSPQSWNRKTGTTHLFSNVGVSLAYEQDIAKNFSIKAEPFVRIPIKDVGWGNVALYSVGTMISLNYYLH